LSRESHNLAEAEAVDRAEGNMCGPARRGTDAPPWSKTPSRPKGTRRNLGGLVWSAVAAAISDQGWKSRRRSGPGTDEESDALHITEEAPEQSRDGPGIQGVGGCGGRGGKGARSEEERTAMHVPGAEPDKARNQSGLRTDRGCGPCQWPSYAITSDLRQEPGAGKPHAGICAGGGEQSPSLPRPVTP